MPEGAVVVDGAVAVVVRLHKVRQRLPPQALQFRRLPAAVVGVVAVRVGVLELRPRGA